MVRESEGFEAGHPNGIMTAVPMDMMTIMIIVFVLIGAGLIIELIAAARSPFGYQDESGFHFGRERANDADEFECGNPS